jgi:hypothetical protein
MTYREEIVSAVFRCHACGESAASVELIPRGVPHPDDEYLNRWLEEREDAAASVAIRDFLTQYGGAINLSTVVSNEEYPLVKAALIECDPHALHDVYPDPDSKIASFYCAACKHCYCTDHWKLREVYEPGTGYFEDWEGECPQGHTLIID